LLGRPFNRGVRAEEPPFEVLRAVMNSSLVEDTAPFHVK